MSNQISIPWSRRSLFWGYATGISALLRAASYAILPPDSAALSSRTFENILPYSGWSSIMFVLGTIIILGTAFQMARLAYAGHLLVFFCYMTFAYSSVTGIVEWVGAQDRSDPDWIVILALPAGFAYWLGVMEPILILQQGWTGIAPLVIVAMVNGERCLNLGAIIRLELEARRVKPSLEDENE